MIPRYFGSKTGAGVIQQIISLMPVHDRYVEPFVGGGSVLESKRPSRLSVVGDIDRDVMRHHMKAPLAGVEYFRLPWSELLPSLNLTRADLVYCDPPYHPSTRGARRYKFDMGDAEHRALLTWLDRSTAKVMLSGFRCDLYDELLAGWARTDFNRMTRGGARVESVWTNFAPGESFHDTRFLGGDFRARERIKRKKTRWLSRFMTMAADERAVIWEALSEASAAIARRHRLGNNPR